MTSLVYLVQRQLVNGWKELLKKPGKLILYLIWLGFMIWLLFMSMTRERYGHQNLQSTAVFAAICVAITMVLLGYGIYASIQGNISFFRSSDVAFLFAGPFQAWKILLYGFLKQIGVTFFALFLWIYQFPNLSLNFNLQKNAFGILIGGLLLLQIFISVLGMLLFAMSSSKPALKQMFQKIFQGLGALVAGGFVYYLIQIKDLLPAAIAYFGADFFRFIPILSWFSTLFISAAEGWTGATTVALGLSLLSILIPLMLLFRMSTDFYEGAAEATENKEVVLAQKKAQNFSLKSKGKVHKASISYAQGAWAIFSRQLLEQKKQGFGLVNKTVLFYGIIGFVLASVLKKNGIWVLYWGLYMNLFFMEAGPWAREMARPWFFLIPASPFQKVLAATLVEHMNNFMNALACFAVMGFMTKENPVTLALTILTYVTGSAVILYMGTALRRTAGAEIGRVAFRFLLLFSGGALLGLGVGLSFLITSYAFPHGSLPLTLALQVVYNTLISGMLIRASRDLAEKMELR